MYNPNEISKFYNNYGENEWQRLEFKSYRKRTLADNGEFLLARGVKL